MKSLTQYLFETLINKDANILEGGASGHMAHPIDFNDFTNYVEKRINRGL